MPDIRRGNAREHHNQSISGLASNSQKFPHKNSNDSHYYIGMIVPEIRRD
jgi:hypothetical protein